MKKAKDFVFTVRLPRDVGGELDQMCIATHTDRPTLVRAALGAVMDYYKANGSISLPIIVVPKTKKQKPARAANAA